MRAANVRQMLLFLIIRNMGANTLGHSQNQRLVAQPKPIAPPNQRAIRVTGKGIFWVSPQIWRIQFAHTKLLNCMGGMCPVGLLRKGPQALGRWEASKILVQFDLNYTA